jgi:integrase
MPKKARELSVLAVKRLKEPGMHAVGGVAGLYLQVTDTGARSWVLRTTVGTRRREIGLGGADDVSLAAARDRARVVRAKVAEGIDPVAERRRARMEHARVLSFDEAASRMIEAKGSEWRNAKHRRQWTTTLKTYASPRIGRRPVDEIEVRDIEGVLSPIWKDKTETAMRLRGRIEAVLAWATVAGYRRGDNPARWRHNLDKLLPKPSKVRETAHHPALPVDDLPRFMAALRSREGVAARALELLILTASRSQEIRLAEHAEFGLDAKLWTVPAGHMKAGREHLVPLSKRALAIMRSIAHMAGSPLAFPAPRGGGPLSDMALSKVIRDMHAAELQAGRKGFIDPKQGRVAVPHGFRSTFRDWASERTNYPREVAEMALAHTIDDKVEAAYRRGDLLTKRARMMEEWAKFIDAPPKAGSVTPIRRKAG